MHFSRDLRDLSAPLITHDISVLFVSSGDGVGSAMPVSMPIETEAATTIGVMGDKPRGSIGRIKRVGLMGAFFAWMWLDLIGIDLSVRSFPCCAGYLKETICQRGLRPLKRLDGGRI